VAGKTIANHGALTERIPLLSVDPDLARMMSPAERAAAGPELCAPIGTLTPGSWDPPGEPPQGVGLGLLMLEGAAIREVRVRGSEAVELLGTGDLIRPWQEDSASFSESCWRVIEPTRVALLDDEVAAAIARWPAVTTALVERALRRSRWLVVQAAVASLVGIENRLLTTLWHIAEKWGSRKDGAIVITVPITHRLLAEMIGAGRPYVTRALSDLRASGRVSQGTDRLYVLHGEPPAEATDGLQTD
jgi:CRP/FNR family cyclic AMP-dependent transcriptional regulator